VGGEHFTISAQ